MESSFQCELVGERFKDESVREELQGQSSAFSIDVNPRLLLASEDLVEVLITSGVGRYLEFAALENTYVVLPQGGEASEKDAVWEVPCSKKDVFQSKLLGMVEKRQLMKFLQFVADYGETHILHEDVSTKNERSLALGRALKRPQNKASQAAQDDITAYLDGPFQVLLEKHFKLSPKLQQVVVYCVALASFPAEKNQMTARDGLANVYRYVASIGRFAGTAFLVPLYGVSEIAQSFCRLCAVYGGIYVLRAPIDGFVVDKATDKVVGIRCTDGDVVRAKNVVTNGSYVECLTQAVSDGVPARRMHGKVLRGVFLLKSSLRDGKSRVIMVIPPGDAKLQNPFAVQVVQLDASVYVCPREYYLVHISMALPADWLDDQERQRRLVHSVMEEAISSAKAEKDGGNGKAGDATSAPDPNVGGEGGGWIDDVVWEAVFTMDHLSSPNHPPNDRAVAGKDSAAASDSEPSLQGLPHNVWVCETVPNAGVDSALPVHPLEIHLESASANARAIFEQLCPGEEFLPKSASAEQAEQEELAGEEDAVLEAAQKLAAKAPSVAATASPSDQDGSRGDEKTAEARSGEEELPAVATATSTSDDGPSDDGNGGSQSVAASECPDPDRGEYAKLEV